MFNLSKLTDNQRKALREAYQDALLRVDGEPSPAFILRCRGNISRGLIEYDLAVPGGKLGKADAVVLTVMGEAVRKQLV